MLAALHSVDLVASKLSSFGKADGFYARQIARMGSTSRAQEIPDQIEPIPRLGELLRWYEHHLPPDRSSLVHGDYKFDNLIFHGAESRVIGVLDWEMATIGHPLSDLANFCMPYYFPSGDPPPLAGIADLPPDHGVPTLEQVQRAYAASSGLAYPLPGWDFCISFAFFRVPLLLLEGSAQFFFSFVVLVVLVVVVVIVPCCRRR